MTPIRDPLSAAQADEFLRLYEEHFRTSVNPRSLEAKMCLNFVAALSPLLSAKPAQQPADTPGSRMTILGEQERVATEREIVVLGIPQDSDCWAENDPRRHNCDAMGCGSAHVLARIPRFVPAQQPADAELLAALRIANAFCRSLPAGVCPDTVAIPISEAIKQAESATRESIEANQRERMQERFSIRKTSHATADFDLIAPNDPVESAQEGKK